MTKTEVRLSKNAEKDIKRLPKNIKEAFFSWFDMVEEEGLAYARKIPGYHDEPLKGDRAGQRSVRLNRAYRAIYCVTRDGLEIVTVLEVNKHKY
jgi:toxin HigB-1